MYRTAMVVLVAGSLIACKGKDDKASTSSATETAPAGSSAAGPAATSGNGDPVDVCGFVTKEQVEAAIGKLREDPKPMQPQGSLLGGCDYMTEEMMIYSVSARPAGEFDATVKMGGDATDVPGVGEKAVSTKSGVLVKLAGKPYFLHALAAGGNGLDPEKAQAIAKVVAPGAK